MFKTQYALALAHISFLYADAISKTEIQPECLETYKSRLAFHKACRILLEDLKDNEETELQEILRTFRNSLSNLQSHKEWQAGGGK